jgi:Circadian oscillating protein COP23
MGRLNIASMSALSLLASVSVLSMMTPARASEPKFSCGTSKGVPATLAHTSRGNIAIIRWVSTTFEDAGYSADYRCKLVSSKFQAYYKAGTLNYLTTGISNNQPVICVAAMKGGACSGVLFTLKPGADSWKTLTRLMDIRVQAGAPALNESSGSSSNDDSQYIDMSNYLATAPTEDASIPAETLPSNQSFSTPTVPTKSLW